MSEILSNDKEKALIEKIRKRKQEADNARTTAGLPSKWSRYYDLVKNNYKPSAEEARQYGKDISLPESRAIYKNIVAKLLGPFAIDKGEWLYCQPLNESSIGNASFMEKAMRYYAKKINYKSKIEDKVKIGTAMGTHIRKVWWSNIKGKKQALDELGNPLFDIYGKPILEEYIKDEGLNVVNCELEEIYIDPKAGEIEKAEYIIHETYMLKHEIEKMMNENLWDSSKRSLLESKDLSDFNNGMNPDKDYRSIQIGTANSGTETKHRYKVWEYWEAGSSPRVVVVINERLIVRDDSETFKAAGSRLPFFLWSYDSWPGELYGESLFMDVETLQSLINSIVNLILDNITITVHPFGTLTGSFDDDDLDDIKIKPGTIIKLNEGSSINFPIIDSRSAELWNVISILRNMIAAVSGSTDQMRGLPGQGNETASAAMQRAQSAQSYFDVIFKRFCESEKEFWEYCCMLIQVYQQKDITLIYKDETNEDNYTTDRIRRYQIDGDFEINIDVDPFGLSLNLIIQQLMQLYERVKGRPDVDDQMILKQIAGLQKMKEINKIFLSEEGQFNRRLSQAIINMSVEPMAQQLLNAAVPPPPPPVANGMIPPQGMQMPDNIPIMPGNGNAGLIPESGMAVTEGNINSIQDLMRMLGSSIGKAENLPEMTEVME